MVLQWFVEGRSRFICECRDSTGKCFYRKYSDDDRERFYFERVPSTKDGHEFRVFTVKTEEDKRLRIIADKRALSYIAREIKKLQGVDYIPERRRNKQAVAMQGLIGVVHQTNDQRKLMGPKLENYTDPELIEGEWLPSAAISIPEEELRAIADQATFPGVEEAPDNFDLETWRKGTRTNFSDEVLDEPEKAVVDPLGSPVHAHKADDDQLQYKGEKEPRSERMARKGAKS